jgi:hypothetical protein
LLLFFLMKIKHLCSYKNSNYKLKTSLLTTNKPIVILISLSVLLTVLILFWYLSYSNINISVEKNKGVGPFQAVINYEITGWNKNKTYLINFDDFLNNYKKVALPYEKKTITHTYHYADVYRVQVYSKTDTIAKFPVVVETNNWQHVLAVFGDPNIYVTLEPNNSYSSNSILYIDPKIVANHGIDTLNKYWVKHRYIKNLDLDGNNFRLELRVRMQSKLNGIDCPEIDIAVPCLHEIFKFKVFYPGCGSIENTTIFGEKRFDGTYTDLSNFGHDITKWTNISLTVKNKVVEVNYNDSVVYQTVYKNHAGPVNGILFNTLRSAEIDFVRLSDLEGNIVFEDDF